MDESIDLHKSIKIHVMAHLCWDNRLEDSIINVTYDSGVVTLTGLVHEPDLLEQAEKDTLAVEGVHQVNNRLNVQRLSTH